MAESLYVCEFSSGQIKVGRSIQPQARIAAHADRVACVGVELVDYRTFACRGSAVQPEDDLIALCSEAASLRLKSEWFCGLEFTLVCQWAAELAEREYPDPSDPASPLRLYLNSLPQGGIKKLASELGIGPVYLTQLADGFHGKEPGGILCVRIEQATKGAVTRRHLRADWRFMWPELALQEEGN